MILPKKFYQKSTPALAKSLLGCFISHSSAAGETVGRIVETEAYLFKNDPACHAHKGMSKRNEAMFGRAGTSYVYLIYGMYYCLNVVSNKEGVGEAVLIRALEPVSGTRLMSKRRKRQKETDLCSGPGKLTQALGISVKQNALCLKTSPLRVHSRQSYAAQYETQHKAPKKLKIVTTTRIGINKGVELPLRFYIADNQFISCK